MQKRQGFFLSARSEGADLCISGVKEHQGDLGLALPCYWCLHLQPLLRAETQGRDLLVS